MGPLVFLCLSGNWKTGRRKFGLSPRLTMVKHIGELDSLTFRKEENRNGRCQTFGLKTRWMGVGGEVRRSEPINRLFVVKPAQTDPTISDAPPDDTSYCAAETLYNSYCAARHHGIVRSCALDTQ